MNRDLLIFKIKTIRIKKALLIYMLFSGTRLPTHKFPKKVDKAQSYKKYRFHEVLKSAFKAKKKP